MKWVAACALLVACGRNGFDAEPHDCGTTDAPKDAPSARALIVQSNAVTGASQSDIYLAFPAAQRAGDLNVVIIGCPNGVPIATIADGESNSYATAIGPTSTGIATQTIFYAANIASSSAGNAVHVTLATSDSPDIRILEIAGIDPITPIDGVQAGIGSSTQADSGPVVTMHADDLLIGADFTNSVTTGPATGWTEVLISSNGAIVESMSVDATGAYNATAPIAVMDHWLMQILALRVAP